MVGNTALMRHLICHLRGRRFLFQQKNPLSCFLGVQKWSKKCDSALKHQETISVKAWVKAMDGRITSLGGEGVERFLGNLFRAFDGLFESSSLPAKAAGKAINIMQRVRRIKAVSPNRRLKELLISQLSFCAFIVTMFYHFLWKY